jgi:hypothetical protein
LSQQRKLKALSQLLLLLPAALYLTAISASFKYNNNAQQRHRVSRLTVPARFQLTSFAHQFILMQINADAACHAQPLLQILG